MGHVGVAVFYSVFFFGLMLVGLLYPTPSASLMVILGKDVENDSIYRVLAGTDARLIEQVSPRRFVVRGQSDGLVKQLYKNGAFLVIRAVTDVGCAAPTNTLKFTSFGEEKP